ncbi:hypothetical protein [Myxococcus xanthus]|uniref:hypothetical protein n=1 Tax=Myxococcus xanthus TaxID=34 RepID=UPI00148D9474|nr:hypothetical protein [Myxococcus xanthus]NOJ86909.1 hypothetical protein [Myxococcus xanthus]
MASTTYLTGAMRLSKRLVKSFFADVLRGPVGLGQVPRLDAQVTSAPQAPRYMCAQQVAHGGWWTTRWRCSPCTSGRAMARCAGAPSSLSLS